MHLTRDSMVSFRRSAIALLALLLPSGLAFAQLQPQANYPLLVDLLDTTATYGPVMLTGNPVPPAAPANGVCVNGIYSFNPGGQDVRTPMIANLNSNDFQIDVEFNIAALPTSFQSPVLMAGMLYRWIGIYVQPNGTIGLKYNNSLFSWSTTTVTTGRWYIASIKFDSGTVELILDGQMIHTASLGALTTGNNLNFTTNDFSNARNHNGCIRHLAIWNDATLGNSATATNYGASCGGVGLRANGQPATPPSH